MMQKVFRKTIFLVVALFEMCALCGCAASGEILSEINGDARLCMEVSDYTGSFERTITIKSTQSGTFSVAISPTAGKIKIGITDRNGETLLSVNEQATLSDGPAITRVAGVNGAYQVTIQLKKYSGAFDISWDVIG